MSPLKQPILGSSTRPTGPLLRLGSNAVYGESDGPLTEDSPQLPVNDYGRLKVEAEKAVRKVNPQTLIVRPILMYGWPLPLQRVNPVVHWLNEPRAGPSVKVVVDVQTKPLAPIECVIATQEVEEISKNDSIALTVKATIILVIFPCSTLKEFQFDRLWSLGNFIQRHDRRKVLD